MGIVNLKSTAYNDNMVDLNRTLTEKEFIRGMIEDRAILKDAIKRMHVRVLSSEKRPEANIEGATEAIVVRSITGVLSLVRYEMKEYYTLIKE